MTWNDPHGNSPIAFQQSSINGIFVQMLYGPIQLYGGSPRTSLTGCLCYEKCRSNLYTRCTFHNDPHGNASLEGEHSAAIGIFVHPLYGPVQRNGCGPGSSATGCIHILGNSAVPCSLCVRLGTTLMAMHHSVLNTAANTTFVHPLYGAVKLLGSGPRTFPTGCVHVLGSAGVPSTLGVELRTTLMVIHRLAANTLQSTEFSYTHCTDLYS